MATHSNILARKIPWTEEPGGLQSMVSQSQMQLSAHPHCLKVDSPCFHVTVCAFCMLSHTCSDSWQPHGL